MTYWLQRAATAVLLLLAVSALTFGAMNVLGDPLFNVLGPAAKAGDLRGTALVEGYAIQTLGQPVSTSAGPFTVLDSADSADTLEAMQAVRVAVGDQLPRRADAVASLDGVTVTGDSLVLDRPATATGTVAGGPDPRQLKSVIDAEREYHLDDPLPVRYVRWLGDFVTGDMGVQFSSTGQPPVTDLIQERLPRTLTLVVMAQALAAGISIPWALYAASRANRPVDKVSTLSSFALIALPAFALGVILKYALAIRAGVFPLAYDAQSNWADRLWQTVLPALTIALPAAAVYQRLLRTELITTLQEDFILMARSKGVPRRQVLLKHALRPSLFSFVTVFAINTGTLIGGAFVVEQIFLIPGLGRTVVEAIGREDFPVVLAIVMIVTAAFVVLNLLVDVLYSVIDPRVRP